MARNDLGRLLASIAAGALSAPSKLSESAAVLASNSVSRRLICSSTPEPHQESAINEHQQPQNEEEDTASAINEDQEEEGEDVNQDGEFVNKQTGEVGGPRGPEPTRFGDWERNGRCSDF